MQQIVGFQVKGALAKTASCKFRYPARKEAEHNPGYDFNDAILPAAATCLASTAKRALVG